jgi:hypothetical protein
MGEFTRANGHGKTWTFAIEDIFSKTNFAVAIASGLAGYLVFEYLRKKTLGHSKSQVQSQELWCDIQPVARGRAVARAV